MNALSRLLVVWLLLMMSASTSGAVVRDVKVVGLFTNAAVLEIEGEQELLNAGGAHEGVQLVTASRRCVSGRRAGHCPCPKKSVVASEHLQSRRFALERMLVVSIGLVG